MSPVQSPGFAFTHNYFPSNLCIAVD
jgi:hypothetical protein